jgi:predicted dehydrogenase
MKTPSQTHVLGLAHPPLPMVRLAFIGLGNRGVLTLQRYLQIEGVEIKALCEIREGNLVKAQKILREAGYPQPDGYTGPDGWKRMCERDDIDLVFICTDWLTHTPMAVYSMEHGKHVAIEVPAAMTVEECWKLVDTAEKTRQHCMMLENCCYDPFALTTLNMAQQGVFGEITHVEGAYIHDLRSIYFADESKGGFHNHWGKKYSIEHTGNPYPTHGLGPVCQILNIHREWGMCQSEHMCLRRSFHV